MPKRTGKKVTVVRDELGMKGGGLYCYMPFDRLDRFKKAVFKIGLAINFNSRTEQYHTYFPNGVYMVAFLENPPVKTKALRSDNGKTPKNKKSHYITIENFILNYITVHGGKRIYSTTRVKNPNEKNEGETEWEYTDESLIHQAFQEAQRIYGGKLNLYYLEGLDPLTNQFTSINQIATKMEQNKPNYVGKIIFHT